MHARLLIANHLDQSSWLTNQKQRAAVGSFFSTLLWQVLGFAVTVISLSKLCKSAMPKPFCWAQPAWFHFASILICRVTLYILRTDGVALNAVNRRHGRPGMGMRGHMGGALMGVGLLKGMLSDRLAMGLGWLRGGMDVNMGVAPESHLLKSLTDYNARLICCMFM
jgi:hypothetical protein